MSTKEIVRFRDMLVTIRKEILERIIQMESTWRNPGERSIEIEEEVQKATITRAYDRLGEDGRGKIELIDLALSKILIGEYGICEGCGDDIAEKRLEALPWTRLCIECARDNERKPSILPQPGELIAAARMGDEYQNLTGDQLLRAIHDRIEEDGQVEAERLKISLKEGIVYLEGSVPGELDHQILLQIVIEDMGLRAVVDRVQVNESEWEADEPEGAIVPAPSDLENTTA